MERFEIIRKHITQIRITYGGSTILFYINRPNYQVKYLLHHLYGGEYYAEMWSDKTHHWLPAPQKLAKILALIAFPIVITKQIPRYRKLPKPWH